MIDHIGAFREFAQSAGIPLSGDIFPDGKLHRIHAEGDKKGSRNAWYFFHTDEPVVGGVGSWKSGVTGKFTLKPETVMTPAELDQIARRMEAIRQEREAEEEKLHAECRRWCSNIFPKAKPADPNHPYFRSKGVKAYGVKALKKMLMIPLRDSAGELQGAQFIAPDGTKKFKTGTNKKGSYFSIGQPKDNILIICEGYATGASLHECTGYAVAVAFDAGNLKPVSEVLREKFPNIKIIIAADNDESGIGQTKAQEAALAVGGIVVIPPTQGHDFNDMNQQTGSVAVKILIENVIKRDVQSDDYSHTRNKDTSYPSYPSFSNIYTSCDPSFNESMVHFSNSLVVPGRKPKLLQQSAAARKIAEELRGKFAFCDEAMSWYRYTVSHWEECHTNKIETEITNLLYTGAGAIGFSSVFARGVSDLLKKCEVIRLPQRQSGTIPFQNGLLEIQTMQLIPVTPANATTWALPYDYEKGAKCPNFLAWLSTAIDSDQATIQLLRAWINAVLIGRSYLQIFLHLLGPGGSGKSTFVRVIFAISGSKNCTTTSLRQIETNRFELANIFGKLVVAIEEADKYGGSVSVLKSMTGEDPLRLERKNKQQMGSFIFRGQVVITGNEHFSTNDNSSGLERRRLEVAFKRRISAEERAEWNARGGEEILYREIPGIVNWALEMSDAEVREIFHGLPERVRQSNLEAARANNPMIDWMLKNLVADPKASTQIGVKQESRIGGEIIYKDADARLYPNYLTFCQENGRESLSLKRFTTVLQDAAETYGVRINKKREMDGTKIFGLRIRQDFEDSWLSKIENEVCVDQMNNKMMDKCPIMHDMKDMNTSTSAYIENSEIEPETDFQNFEDDDLEVSIK